MIMLLILKNLNLAMNPELYRKIRNAEEPNNCQLVLHCLDEEVRACRGCLYEYRQSLRDQFKLLLDTAADEILPSHWRQLCMDRIHRPLGVLWSLANTSSAKQEVMGLYAEVRIVGDYIAPGLVSGSNRVMSS